MYWLWRNDPIAVTLAPVVPYLLIAGLGLTLCLAIWLVMSCSHAIKFIPKKYHMIGRDISLPTSDQKTQSSLENVVDNNPTLYELDDVSICLLYAFIAMD